MPDAKTRGRDHRAGRLLRRLGALHEERPRAPRLQLLRPRAHERRVAKRRSRRASTRSCTSSFPTRRSRAPAASRSSASTARRSPRATSRRRSRSCSPPTRARTSAWTARPSVSTDYRPVRQRLHRQDRQGDGRAAVTRSSTPERMRPLPQGSGRCRFRRSRRFTSRRSPRAAPSRRRPSRARSG